MKWIAHTRGGDKKSKSLFRMYYTYLLHGAESFLRS